MAMRRATKDREFQQGRPEGYMTVREAMAAYGCSEPTVRRWLQQRLVKAVRYRRHVLILAEDVRRLDAIRPYRPQPSKASYRTRLRATERDAESVRQMEA